MSGSKFFNVRKKIKEDAAKAAESEVIAEYITTDMPTKKAYNFFYNDERKSYMKETISYTNEKIVNITQEAVSDSIGMTMYAIKKLFTEKLILKKENL